MNISVEFLDSEEVKKFCLLLAGALALVVIYYGVRQNALGVAILLSVPFFIIGFILNYHLRWDCHWVVMAALCVLIPILIWMVCWSDWRADEAFFRLLSSNWWMIVTMVPSGAAGCLFGKYLAQIWHKQQKEKR
jgi:hypothetical protein